MLPSIMYIIVAGQQQLWLDSPQSAVDLFLFLLLVKFCRVPASLRALFDIRINNIIITSGTDSIQSEEAEHPALTCGSRGIHKEQLFNLLTSSRYLFIPVKKAS